jgi:hypothetical protein
MDIEYSDILHTFLNIINQIKIYHWQTFSYARHKATDELYGELNDLIDQFVEVLTGRIIIETNNSKFRIKVDTYRFKLIDFTNENEGTNLLIIIKNILEKDLNLLKVLEGNTDLTNIRDEMLGLINKNGYLFTLN